MRKTPSVERLVEIFKKHLKIDVIRTAKYRHKEYTVHRQMFCYLLRKRGMKVADIGKILNQNHATIIRNIELYNSVREFSSEGMVMEEKIVLEWFGYHGKGQFEIDIFLHVWDMFGAMQKYEKEKKQ